MPYTIHDNGWYFTGVTRESGYPAWDNEFQNAKLFMLAGDAEEELAKWPYKPEAKIGIEVKRVIYGIN
jgi:hypothetical protein